MFEVRNLAILILNNIAPLLYVLSTRLLRYCHPEWRCRYWSNRELRKLGHLFQGDIINVSGWKDQDKEGGYYADYFPQKSSYSISNIKGEHGLSGQKNEIYLNLEEDLPDNLHKKFDVVFNHTVLEHVYDIRKAGANLCTLSRNIVIVVVPFMQPMHWEPESYLDYWRPTPFVFDKLFKENGFEIIY